MTHRFSRIRYRGCRAKRHAKALAQANPPPIEDEPSPGQDGWEASTCSSVLAMAETERNGDLPAEDAEKARRRRLARAIEALSITVFSPVKTEHELLPSDSWNEAVASEPASRPSVRMAMGDMLDGCPPEVLGVRWLILPRRSVIIVSFSQDMELERIENLHNYSVVASDGRPVDLVAAAYGAIPRALILFPGTWLDADNLYRLRLNGSSPSGLANDRGLLLDGRGEGRPGRDFVTILCHANLMLRMGGPASRKSGAGEANDRPSLPAPRRPAPAVVPARIAPPTPLAVDAVLRAEGLTARGTFRLGR